MGAGWLGVFLLPCATLRVVKQAIKICKKHNKQTRTMRQRGGVKQKDAEGGGRKGKKGMAGTGERVRGRVSRHA